MAKRPVKGFQSPRAEELFRTWTKDRESFPAALSAALDDSDDASLDEAIRRIPASSRGLIEEEVTVASASFPLPGNALARLFAIPVLVHPGDGTSPDEGALASALSFTASGMLPRGPYAILLPSYVDPEEVLSLPFSGRRALAKAIAEGVESPDILPAFAIPDPGADRRGVPAAVVGVIISTAENGPTFLDEEADDKAILRFQKLAMASGGGIVDVEEPFWVDGMAGAFEDDDAWFNASSKAREELCDFVTAAEIEAAEDGVACEVDRLPDRLIVRLRDAAGLLLDERTIVPGMFPLAPGEVVRILNAACRSCAARDTTPPAAAFTVTSFRTEGSVRPAVRKPSLKIVGGRAPAERPEVPSQIPAASAR